MLQFSKSDSVMDARDHFKKGVSSKNLMSRRKQFIHLIFVFTFLFCCFSLKAQFDNEKYDKESFLIGTLNEYMDYQRTFTTNGDISCYQRVDIFSQQGLKNALFIDALFNSDYSDITIVNNGAPQGIKIYSPALSLKIDDYYNYKPSGRFSLEIDKNFNSEKIDTWRIDTIYSGHLKKEMFKTEKQKLSFLLGVYLNYNREKRNEAAPESTVAREQHNFIKEIENKYDYVFYMPNAQSKAKVCVEILKDLGCNVEYATLQNIPVGHFVFFTPSNELREVINEAERLKKHIELIDTKKVKFTRNGTKFIWVKPKKR